MHEKNTRIQKYMKKKHTNKNTRNRNTRKALKNIFFRVYLFHEFFLGVLTLPELSKNEYFPKKNKSPPAVLRQKDKITPLLE